MTQPALEEYQEIIAHDHKMLNLMSLKNRIYSAEIDRLHKRINELESQEGHKKIKERLIELEQNHQMNRHLVADLNALRKENKTLTLKLNRYETCEYVTESLCGQGSFSHPLCDTCKQTITKGDDE